MRIGLIGLPLVGKTTIFNLLCETDIPASTYLSGKLEPNHGMARVPDTRLDRLGELFRPRRVVNAQMEITDLPGLRHGTDGKGNVFLQHVRQVDALVQVIRAFDGNIDHVDGSVNPLRDADNIQAELLMADIDLVEKRMERINEGRKITTEHRAELLVLEKCLNALQEENPMARIDLTETERQLISHYGFLTQKPQLVVVNVDESQYRHRSYPQQALLDSWTTSRGYASLTLSCALEAEIARLPSEDKRAFMDDLGVTESAAYRLAHMMYSLLNQISFFTVGDDEVRAWTISEGTDAKRAAGKIHSDLERGFIRAETSSCDDIFALGSMAKLKEKGLLRLEGRDYVVKDGDILTIRFNV